VKIEPIDEWPQDAEATDIAKGPDGEKRANVELSLLQSLNELQRLADNKSPDRDKEGEEQSKDKDGGNPDRSDVWPNSD
jgi:hypothetical protein